LAGTTVNDEDTIHRIRLSQVTSLRLAVDELVRAVQAASALLDACPYNDQVSAWRRRSSEAVRTAREAEKV
jgi:hypothetical protein